MTSEDIKRIRAWLAGPRDMTEGAALYRRYGTNLMLKRQFESVRTPLAHDMLVNQLRILAGLSEPELQRIPRKASTNTGPSATPPPAAERPKEIPETEKQKIRFRERFPFLSADDCPDVLKVLVNDMFTAYGKFREAFAALQAGDTKRLMDKECEAAVENFLEDRSILDELTHYRDHGELLGKHPKVRATLHSEEDPDYMTMDVAELVKKLNSAQVNVSKATSALKKADTDDRRAAAEERLEKWKIRLETIRAVVELRKKN